MKINCLNFSGCDVSRYFFLYGSELVLKQEIADQILQSLQAGGFNDRVLLHQDELDQAEEIIMRNIEIAFNWTCRAYTYRFIS